MKEITIIIKLCEEGLHFWENAETLPEVAYLQHPHRHTFYFECEFSVPNTNRDREFIITKREIQSYLHSKFFSVDKNCLDFGGMSCEQIAEDLFLNFDLVTCMVGEDDEFYAKLKKKKSKPKSLIGK